MCFLLFDDFSVQGDLNVLEVKSNSQAPCEATNKEAFFSRVESYSISFFPSFWISMSHLSSCFYVMLLLLHVLAVCKLKFPLAPHCLKWAGKPRILSPLMCARYGWISVGCDMLKCCSCQAFLCASLQPTLDFEKCEWNLKQLHNNNTRGQTGCFGFFGKVRLILLGCQKFFFLNWSTSPLLNRWKPHCRDIKAASDTAWKVLSLAWLSMSRWEQAFCIKRIYQQK